MSQREFSYRQTQAAIQAINCLMEPDGAFAFLPDLIQFRISILAHEISAAGRRYEAAVGPRRMEYALREPSTNGTKGALIHPRNHKGEPNLGEIIVSPDKRVEFDAAMQELLEETVAIDVKEIKASQLRREVTVDGKKEQRIPAGWWTIEGENGERIKHPLGPSGILMGLAPFIVMDLDEG